MNERTTTVKRNNVSLEIHSYTTSKGYPEHRFRFKDDSGKRRCKVFSDFEEAKQEADFLYKLSFLFVR
jgi:hypothetical protein